MRPKRSGQQPQGMKKVIRRELFRRRRLGAEMKGKEDVGRW